MSIIPPIVDPTLSEEAVHRLPSIKSALLMLSCALKQRTAMELNLINQEAEKGKGDQHICQVFFAVTVVVLKTIAGSIRSRSERSHSPSPLC
ncbi:MAG: hypothetical protein OXC62_09060, partial [Aestuariivita sp.]|nr:hypothetical protein [Aestuariivita sp.]